MDLDEWQIYDVCVIGAGLIGSAAAKYTGLSGLRTVLLGPEEPSNRSMQDKRFVYGAYFDEGRITRTFDKDPDWAHLAKESVARYREIEQASGIPFYHERGCLLRALPTQVQECVKILQEQTNSHHKMTVAEVEFNFPYLAAKPYTAALIQETKAGYINPRRMLKAQKKIAESSGVTVVNDIATLLFKNTHLKYGSFFEISTEKGSRFLSKRILLANSGYVNLFPFLPDNLEANLYFLTQTVIFAEVPTADLKIFQNMPCMIDKDDTSSTIYRNVPNESCYIMPPIQYPDGRYYLKLGHSSQFEKKLFSEMEIKEWYCHSPPAEVKLGLLNILKSHFPDFRPASVKYDTCLSCHTPTNHLYIDMVTHDIGVVLGCNGYAAKSSDEIGRIAAELIGHNKWDTPLNKKDYVFIPKKEDLEAKL